MTFIQIQVLCNVRSFPPRRTAKTSTCFPNKRIALNEWMFCTDGWRMMQIMMRPFFCLPVASALRVSRLLFAWSEGWHPNITFFLGTTIPSFCNYFLDKQTAHNSTLPQSSMLLIQNPKTILFCSSNSQHPDVGNSRDLKTALSVQVGSKQLYKWSKSRICVSRVFWTAFCKQLDCLLTWWGTAFIKHIEKCNACSAKFQIPDKRKTCTTCAYRTNEASNNLRVRVLLVSDLLFLFKAMLSFMRKNVHIAHKDLVNFTIRQSVYQKTKMYNVLTDLSTPYLVQS